MTVAVDPSSSCLYQPSSPWSLHLRVQVMITGTVNSHACSDLPIHTHFLIHCSSERKACHSPASDWGGIKIITGST